MSLDELGSELVSFWADNRVLCAGQRMNQEG